MDHEYNLNMWSSFITHPRNMNLKNFPKEIENNTIKYKLGYMDREPTFNNTCIFDISNTGPIGLIRPTVTINYHFLKKFSNIQFG